MPDALATAVTNTNPNSCVNVYCMRFGKPWNVSANGLSFLATWESGTLNGRNWEGHYVTDGFILKAYRDNKGIPTVGCGHRILASDNIQIGQTITLERAREFKRRNVSRMEQRLNNDVHLPLFQFEYDALVSVAYNCGENSGSDELIRMINTGHYEKMFDVIRTYRVGDNSNLLPRRFSEARLFASGVYDASH